MDQLSNYDKVQLCNQYNITIKYMVHAQVRKQKLTNVREQISWAILLSQQKSYPPKLFVEKWKHLYTFFLLQCLDYVDDEK